uniref:COP9 signalosome complex subunit 1 n=1 Tax=Leptobrachium leishanense TaxID=445787 RepID=A0A8C5Q755_9ANUR
MPLPVQVFNLQGAVEPMQIDADPQDDQQNVPDINYVVENPTLDLEQYASSYSGLMRIERLQFIADHCPQLRVEALKMALSFVQRTFNVDVYEEIHRKLSEASRELQNTPDAVPEGSMDPPPLDTTWVEATRKKALLKLEKLDTDLKNYKGNSIKESIRRGHDDLGDHYLDCGDLSNALKCYSRARDYCTSAKHVINMCLNVIKVSVYLQNWSHVLSYVSKAESTPEIAEQRGERDSQTQAVLTKLKCAAGLAELAARKYKQAAKCFLLASFDHCDFPELLSSNNVAVYGGLCALATFDRQELQRNVISSSSFKLFLELEPQVRDIIFKFYESKYASCLKMLDEMKDNLLLDMYLAPHVRILYTQIRNRALIQVCDARSSVTFAAACFDLFPSSDSPNLFCCCLFCSSHHLLHVLTVLICGKGCKDTAVLCHSSGSLIFLVFLSFFILRHTDKEQKTLQGTAAVFSTSYIYIYHPVCVLARTYSVYMYM